MIAAIPGFSVVVIDRKRREIVRELPVICWTQELAPCTPNGVEPLAASAATVSALRLPDSRLLFNGETYRDADELLDWLIEQEVVAELESREIAP